MKVLLSILVFLFAFNTGFSNITSNDNKQEIVKVKKSDVDYKTCDLNIDNVVNQNVATFEYYNYIYTNAISELATVCINDYTFRTIDDTKLFNNVLEFT